MDFLLADDTLRLGVVGGGSRDRPSLTDQNGRQHTISARSIVVLHAERPASGRISAQLEPVLNRVSQFVAEVDTELLWESVQAEGKELSAEDLCTLYFGESDCCRCSAIWRAVLDDPLRFRRRAGRIQARPADQVEAQLTGERRKAEREEQRRRVRDWAAHVLAEGSEEGVEPLPDREGVLRRLEASLLQRQPDEEVIRWLDGLDPETTPRMAAHDLLALLGRLPAAADPFLSAAGIDPRFAREATDLASALVPFDGADGREDWTGILTYAIDDEETREVDDAFSVFADGDGYVLGIHIADPSHFIRRDDPLDLEAQKRISTLYLPQTTVRMLPERISCDLASLVREKVRPALTLRIRVSAEGEPQSWELAPSRIQVTRNLTYDEADAILTDHEPGDGSRLLLRVRELTDGLAAARTRDGAFTVNRPEIKVSVRNGEISLKVLETDTPSRKFVSELMVLFNTWVADLCRRGSIPFIYRCQARPAQLPELPSRYDPVLVNEALSRMERSRYSMQPAAHGGLGVDGYTQLTSPIRRYLDLVLQRQITAALLVQPLPYSDQDLLAVMEMVQTQDAELRATERRANRFYCLSWLDRNRREEVLEAVVLRPGDRGGYLVETKDFFIRGILDTAADLTPGTVISCRVSRLNPQRNTCVLIPA